MAMHTQIQFFLMPGTNLLDLAGAAQVFQEAGEQGCAVHLGYCAAAPHLASTTGLPIGPLPHFTTVQLQAGDYLFLCSADYRLMVTSALQPATDLLDWIRAQYERGVRICAICNGAFLLGHTGLLNGRSCTTHWKRTGDLQKRFPLARVVENVLFVEDNGVITSAGAASGVDVALHILQHLQDEYATWKVARELVIYQRRAGNHVQQSAFVNYRNHVHAGIHRVQDWLHTHLHTRVLLADLAGIAGMSERNFTRIFKRETGITVHAYLNLLRESRLRELLRNPDLSRAQMAQQCGLSSEKQVQRLLRNLQQN